MNRITSTITYGNKLPYDQRDEWQRQANPWTAEVRYKRRKMTVNYWTGPLYPGEPTTKDVAYCLLADAQCLEYTQSFEEWCNDLCMDTDSLKAYRTYQQVIKQTDSLKRVLGSDFEDFIGLDEDELKRRCR
jgi:hypothetical protein